MENFIALNEYARSIDPEVKAAHLRLVGTCLAVEDNDGALFEKITGGIEDTLEASHMSYSKDWARAIGAGLEKRKGDEI